MTKFDRSFWEERWSRALDEHGDTGALRTASPHLTKVFAAVPPGRALDAGCGHGAESIWLAGHGWEVTGVDFSPTALEAAHSTADSFGSDIANRTEWIERDLGVWTPEPEHYDLVLSLFVHIVGSVEEFVVRMASAVRPGGTLFLVGHHPLDQNQVSAQSAIDALAEDPWEIHVAEDRERPAGDGVDAVFHADKPWGP
ncbi:MAG: class I SAM-dependent methyltransferase [Solirubrobacterales bacterium]